MPLILCKEQKKQTLEGFYNEWASSDNTTSSALGRAMLRVIEKVNQTFITTTIFAGTSHAHLLFFATETNKADWYIALIANFDEFHIEYKMPKHKQPWKDATVKGATRSLSEFINYLIIAMKESGAWTDSEELTMLYKNVKAEDANANA